MPRSLIEVDRQQSSWRYEEVSLGVQEHGLSPLTRQCHFSFLAAFANGLGTMEIAAHENLAEDRYFRVSAVGLISLLLPPLLLLFSLIMQMIFFLFFGGVGGALRWFPVII